MIIGSLAIGWLRFFDGEAGYSLGAIFTNTLWSMNNLFSLWVIIQAATWAPDPDFDAPVMEEYRNEMA